MIRFEFNNKCPLLDVDDLKVGMTFQIVGSDVVYIVLESFYVRILCSTTNRHDYVLSYFRGSKLQEVDLTITVIPK